MHQATKQHLAGARCQAFGPAVGPRALRRGAAHARRHASVPVRGPAQASAYSGAGITVSLLGGVSRLRLQRRSSACRAATSAATPLADASEVPSTVDAIVVGAGLAGLAAAVHLQAAGLKTLVLEASDGVGGRVRTDKVDGYLLDRGFQIFLTAGPESQRMWDYQGLQLKPFYAGALVRWNNGWHRVADPFRHPVDGVLSLTNPVGSVVDKIRVGLFRLKSVQGSWDDLLKQPETSIKAKLQEEGFSAAIVNRFFRPFLGGIFFDRNLGTSSRMFTYVMRMLALGANTLPVAGIGALADQVADKLAPGSVLLGASVAKVEPGSEGQPVQVHVAGRAQPITATKGVVVAVEGPEAQKLLGNSLATSPSKPSPGVGTCCLYFTAPKPPLPGNVLYLNGGDDGVVNNCCFPSEVSASYAPPGKTLCSVSTVGTYQEMSDEALEAAVRAQLTDWFGKQEVATWKLLRTYRIPFAQPNQAPPTNFTRPVSLGGGLYVAGDHRDTATHDGAMVSGRRAAQALLAARSK